MNFLWWYGVYIFFFRFLLSVLKYHHDSCVFHLYFSFWCHAWMHIFFVLISCLNGYIFRSDVMLKCIYFSFWCHTWMHVFFRGYSNTVTSFFCLLFLLYLICIGFSRFFWCFPFSSKFSSPRTLFLYKYQSLKVYFKFRLCVWV